MVIRNSPKALTAKGLKSVPNVTVVRISQDNQQIICM